MPNVIIICIIYLATLLIHGAELTNPAVVSDDALKYEAMLEMGARKLEAMKRAPVVDLSPEEAQKGYRPVASKAPVQEQTDGRNPRLGLLMRCR